MMNGAREAENLRSVYFFTQILKRYVKYRREEKLKMIFKCVDRRGKQL